MMIALIAKMNIKEGETNKVISLFEELIPNVREEEGTLTYAVCRNQADPNTIFVLERYRDKDALQAHGSTPHFKEFSKKLGQHLAGKPELTVLEEVLSL